MGERRAVRLVIVKFGGSLITFKDKPLTVNKKAILNIAKALGKGQLDLHNEKLFLIHGGGSFGHYYAKEYGVDTKFTKTNPEAVAKICDAMLDLHTQILNAFVSKGINCKTIDSAELIDSTSSKISLNSRKRVNVFLNSNLVPISYGSALVSGLGARIISGDELCLALAKSYNVSKVIFGMDVDGVFKDSTLKGDVIPELDSSSSVTSKLRRWDVTGGLAAKLKLGLEIAKMGTEVYYLNGLHPERIRDVINGNSNVRGSLIRASSARLKEHTRGN